MSLQTDNSSADVSKLAQSYLMTKTRVRVSDLKIAKERKEKFTVLTSYDYVSARIFDQAKIPCLLIGDSAAQTVYGYKSTLSITLDEMIPLARAVSSACSRALVIGDLPFGSYQESPKHALRSSTRFMKESNVHAIKLEGGKEYAEHVRLLTRSGIPVMAHIGFTPQHEHALGGFKIQGRTNEAAERVLQDALALQEAGAFACVLELVPADVGKLVSERLDIPVVGIGAGPSCDAQVLVWHDMAGFSPPNTKGGYLRDSGESQSAGEETKAAPTYEKVRQLELERVPKFVKRYTNLTSFLYDAAISYATDVAEGKFPSKEHCY